MSVPYEAGPTGAPSDQVLLRRGRALDRRAVLDVVARWLVSLGGLGTVGSIIAILGFICIEVYPLLKAPRVAVQSSFALTGGEALVPLADEQRQAMAFVTDAGAVRFVRLHDGGAIATVPFPALAGRTIEASARAGSDRIFLATSDGQLISTRLRFYARRDDGERILQPRLADVTSWSLGEQGEGARILAASTPEDGGVVALFVDGRGMVHSFAVKETQSFLGGVQRTEARRILTLPAGDAATSVSISSNGRRAFVGSKEGLLQYWDLEDPEQPRLVDATPAASRQGVAVTALGLLIGDQSLVVGDGSGAVSVWFPVRDPERESGWRLQQVHRFRSHPSAVTGIAASPRGRSFLSMDEQGHVLLHHSTSAHTLAELPGELGRLTSVVFTPKANGAVGVARSGRAVLWEIVNPHPEATLSTLFGKTWYEGYDRPTYVWQSSGGSDAFEPKLSLMPLIFGTLKGTLYALLFAIPISVLGALYTSQFAHPSLRTFVKPTVEIMAALPSVVLGFLAGLWLAPAIENTVPGVLLSFVVVPLLMLGGGAAWSALPAPLRKRVPAGIEALLLLPVIVAGVRFCLWADPWLQGALFGGDFRQWLFHDAGLRYDQRNCLIIGFAMGFAVIPIIFTIAEDALSNVPNRLVSGSLALGATRWQTALRVVLPTASAGIFSAIMIGFGRAVGETMIVLMATGNTPIMEWNLFTGMRTLSANIAVEMPEAPYGNTLYRVLFLTALLLFVATFVINTIAEVVRIRLRRRFEAL